MEGVTRRQLVKYMGVTVLGCAAFEPIFIALDWWNYYGDQPLDWTELPAHWWFTNAECLVFVTATLYLVRKHLLTSDHQTWVFAPLTLLALWAAKCTDIPLVYVIQTSNSMLVITIASLGTIAIAVFLMYGIVRAIAVPEPGQRPRAVAKTRAAPELATSPS